MSDNKAQVVIVGPQDELFSPVEEGVRAKGYEAVRYRSTEAFLKSPERATRASVLFANSHVPVGREIMAESPNLRAVICPYTGTEGFSQPAATELGIIVGNGQIPENYQSMAEATVLMILAALCDLRGNIRWLEDGWKTRYPGRSYMLKGKTLGFLGFGMIARSVAERLQAWGCPMVAYAPRVHEPFPPYVTQLSFEEVLKTSDIICPLANLNDESQHMLNAQTLALTKKGVIIVNMGRGGLIDEKALYDFAMKGHFRYLALDVFEQEPLPMESLLRTLPKTVLTPHAIGHSHETLERLPIVGLENVLLVLSGKPPLYVRNKAVLPVWEKRFGGQAL